MTFWIPDSKIPFFQNEHTVFKKSLHSNILWSFIDTKKYRTVAKTIFSIIYKLLSCYEVFCFSMAESKSCIVTLLFHTKYYFKMKLASFEGILTLLQSHLRHFYSKIE